MKVMIVNPPQVAGCTVVREERFEHRDMGSTYPPLSHLQVAAMVEQAGHEVCLLDAMGQDLTLAEVQRRMDDFRPEVVFARVAFDCQREDSAVLRYAKEKWQALTISRCKIIAEADFVLREFMTQYPFVDLFTLVEPDAVIVDILRARVTQRPWSDVAGIAWRNQDALAVTSIPEPVQDLDRLPLPAWHLLPSLEPYHTGILPAPFAVIQTTRGCPFNCEFCAYRRNRIRYHSPERVLREIRWLKEHRGLKSFVLFDDVVGLDKARFDRLLQQLVDARLGLKWACCTRADLFTLEQARRMKQAGCVEVAIGVESGAPAVLSRTKKGIDLQQVETAAANCRKAGLLFYAMCIIGLPGETKETIAETCRFIHKIRPFYTQFCFSTPLPSTPNYRWYKERGYLLSEDWSKYSSLYPEPVVRTEALTAAELSELRNWIYRKVLLRPGYLFSQVRLLDWKWNITGAWKVWQRIRAVRKKAVVR
ncbi:MAG: radical SAM protein [Kiritimatiellaeota bacterium]|nr:radical SAM protein [Kiritimatiellota bacterium]